MNLTNIITLIGISTLFFYSIVQILNFYGVGFDVYGYYIIFYVFIIISIVILPNQYPTLWKMIFYKL
jgi:hypothetical protein